jgi:hypothetical protein
VLLKQPAASSTPVPRHIDPEALTDELRQQLDDLRLGDAMAEILDHLPSRRLRASMLTHILRGSQGPWTRETISRHGLPHDGIAAQLPFLAVLGWVRHQAETDRRLLFTGGEVRLVGLAMDSPHVS